MNITTVDSKDLKKYEGKTVSTLLKLAILHFNRYIRNRDADGDYFTCISCGKVKSSDTCNAGHYLNAGHHPKVRFDEMNVNSQCVACNCYSHGNLIEYRKGLVKKYGEDAVLELEQRGKGTKKWERIELIMIILKYKGK